MAYFLNLTRFHVFNILAFPFFLMYMICILLATNPTIAKMYLRAYTMVIIREKVKHEKGQ